MDAFTAVATTGIYCQPGCSARPRVENTRTFALAAAAEAAGYRACLRCRPYRYPHTIGWDAPELVCRAVRLILDGALDDGTEHDLAARVGVSARHLRRLFAAHLGVTPDGLARSARVHFARRLLDDTDLTVTEIAFAAGFRSLRQFNRASREVFHESPRMLRARRRKSDRLVADGGLRLRLAYHGPLDWQALLDYLAARMIPGVECLERDIYRRTIVVDGYPGVLELRPGDPGELLLCAHLPRWDELVHLVRRARAIANLDLSLDEPHAALSGDRLLGPLLAARPGVRPPGTWDGFETGVRAILAEQMTALGADRIGAPLVRRHGMRVPGLEPIGLTHTFPSPEATADADLAELGVTRARARAVRAFAQAVVEGHVRLDRSVGLDELIESLTEIDGVSASVAQYVALRLGEPDAWPAEDPTLDRRLLPGAAVDATPADRAAEWRPWRAFAATHLWLAASAGERERVRGAA